MQVIDSTTLLAVTYSCSVASLLLIFIRLLWRLHRRKQEGAGIHADDVWMAFSTAPLLLRLGFIHVVLVYGTNNVNNPESLSPADIAHRVVGSKMVLATRISYAAFIWCMKICILEFYSRLTDRIRQYNKVLEAMRWSIGLTFIGVVLSTLLECRPFNNYWQVVPSPGSSCTEAIVQLVTMGACNIVTDLALMLLPLPLILKSALPTSRKLQLGLLFSVGFFVVIITIIRMPLIVQDSAVQSLRTFWASIECFAACIVANAPVIYALARRKGSERHHTHPMVHSSERTFRGSTDLVLSESRRQLQQSQDFDTFQGQLSADKILKIKINTTLRQSVAVMRDGSSPPPSARSSEPIIHSRIESDS